MRVKEGEELESPALGVSADPADLEVGTSKLPRPTPEERARTISVATRGTYRGTPKRKPHASCGKAAITALARVSAVRSLTTRDRLHALRGPRPCAVG
jgi:hypothetical protein